MTRIHSHSATPHPTNHTQGSTPKPDVPTQSAVDRNAIIQEKLETQTRPSHQSEASSVAFEDIPTNPSQPQPLPPERQAVSQAGSILDSGYANTKRLSINSQESIGVVSQMNRIERLAIADQVMQIDGLEETLTDENRCGAACITVACFCEGGHEGLLTLINSIESFNENLLSEEFQQNTGSLTEIRAKLENNEPLNFADLARIQEQLYQVLDHSEQQTRGNFEAGLSNRVINQFFEEMPAIAQLFDHNQVTLRHIDNMGDGFGNHFVLFLENQSTVYDPYPRSSGHQISNDPDLVQTYTEAVDPHYGRVRN